MIGTECFHSHNFSYSYSYFGDSELFNIYLAYILAYIWVIPIFGFLPILIFQIIDTDKQNNCCCSCCEVQRTYLSTDDDMVEVYVVKRDYNIENIKHRRE